MLEQVAPEDTAAPAEPRYPPPEKLPPAMRQVVAFKKQHPGYVLLFRMGDFYELFWDDAKLAHRVLGVALTSRNKDDPDPIPMAGVPHHSVEGYLRKLIRAGHRVALCEQVEDPKTAKGVVKRDVTRLITPGTLTDEALLDGRADNFIAALATATTKAHGRQVGLACCELSTGATWAMCGDERAALDALSQLNAAEVLLPERDDGLPHALAPQVKTAGAKLTTARPSWQFEPHHALGEVRKQWQVRGPAGFGFDEADDAAAVCALGALVGYLRETQRGDVAHLRPPTRHRPEQHLLIDPATWRSLEIETTTRGGGHEGSLLSAVDRTRTGMGARMLRAWLRFPLVDLDHIAARQDGVQQLHDAADVRRKLFDALDGACDVERIVGRVSVGRASPRDLASLSRCLAAVPRLLDSVRPLDDRAGGDAVGSELRRLAPFAAEQSAFLARAVRADPAAHLRDGGAIADGFDSELDRLRALARDGGKWLVDYQAQLAAASSIPSLKVSYNKVFGYYIEVTDVHRAKVPADWTRKQTVKNAERYVTPKLKEFEAEALTAAERSVALEQQLFEGVRQALLPEVPRFQELAGTIARLDVLAGLAEVAAERRYCRPKVVAERVLELADARHPVLEQQLGPGGSLDSSRAFVANDCAFGADETLSLLTGPNMAGKSTYIRQVALITLLAQAGSFVPARAATVGVADRLFARIGASDEIHAGQSTFMVEMTETALILNTATAASVVVLDEIGRGTGTLDGLSLAWATAEHLAQHVRCRALFATHYHELTALADTVAGVRNFSVAVREWEDQVVFLHRIAPGGTDRSYGLHVARLAGVPRGVVERARQLLGTLTVTHASPVPQPPPPPDPGQQLALFAYEPGELTKLLKALDPDELSPKAAHELLRRLKSEFG